MRTRTGGLLVREIAGMVFYSSSIMVSEILSTVKAAVEAGMGDGNVPEIFDYFLKLEK